MNLIQEIMALFDEWKENGVENPSMMEDAILGKVEEVTKQIQEIDNDIDAEIQKFGYEGVYPSLIPCECDLVGQKRAIRKVLAVLEGNEKERKP